MFFESVKRQNNSLSVSHLNKMEMNNNTTVEVVRGKSNSNINIDKSKLVMSKSEIETFLILVNSHAFPIKQENQININGKLIDIVA